MQKNISMALLCCFNYIIFHIQYLKNTTKYYKTYYILFLLCLILVKKIRDIAITVGMEMLRTP